MAWKKNRRNRWEDEHSSEYNLRQERIAERGTSYRRNPSHQKKEVSESVLQKREWKHSKSQYRSKGWNRHWKALMKSFIGGNYRAWLRYHISHENWEVFFADGAEFKYQEDPWSWD